jgi:hypothetical protein
LAYSKRRLPERRKMQSEDENRKKNQEAVERWRAKQEKKTWYLWPTKRPEWATEKVCQGKLDYFYERLDEVQKEFDNTVEQSERDRLSRKKFDINKRIQMWERRLSQAKGIEPQYKPSEEDYTPPLCVMECSTEECERCDYANRSRDS